MAYLTQIMRALTKLGMNGTQNPDTSNVGSYFGEAFMWDEVAKYAKNKSDAVWDKMIEEKIIDNPDPTEPKEVELASSKMFACVANVSNPVKRFNSAELCKQLLTSKYKVPHAVALQMIEKSKIGDKGQVKMKIVEKV